MSSIDELSASIAAAKEAAEQVSATFSSVGAETPTHVSQSIADDLEQLHARSESLRGDPGGLANDKSSPTTLTAIPSPPASSKGWIDLPLLGDIPLAREVHILDGDGDDEGGGHRWDSKVPNKTKFPRQWTDSKILESISSVARSPDIPPTEKRKGGWTCEGDRDGVTIEVVLNRDGSVWTGYPLRGPGVERNGR